MERLTTKTGRYYTVDRYSIFHYEEESESIIDKLSNKLGKLEDLEEEIGCPLEIFFRALKEGIYNEGMKHFNIEHYFVDRNSFDIHYNHSVIVFKVSDYKKTWWLKEDKSE